MKSIFSIIALAVYTLFSPISSAQMDDSPLAFLDGHEGEWIASGRRMGPSGWVESQPMPTTIEALYGGRAYIERATHDFGQSQSGLTTIFSWDSFREVYRIVALDEDFGLLDVYEGRMDAEGRLVVTNIRADTYFPFGESARLHFQLRWTFESENQFDFDVLMTSDGGASWSPYFELTYQRLEAE